MSTKNATLYDTDFYAWANEQAALLRAGRLSEADIENIAEEIATLARNEERMLINYLEALFAQLLRWRYQPGFRSRAWQLQIEQQRSRVQHHIEESPSLNSRQDHVIAKAWRDAVYELLRETGLDRDTFPRTCPFTFDEAMHPDFWPD